MTTTNTHPCPQVVILWRKKRKIDSWSDAFHVEPGEWFMSPFLETIVSLRTYYRQLGLALTDNKFANWGTIVWPCAIIFARKEMGSTRKASLHGSILRFLRTQVGHYPQLQAIAGYWGTIVPSLFYYRVKKIFSFLDAPTQSESRRSEYLFTLTPPNGNDRMLVCECSSRELASFARKFMAHK